MRYNDISGYRWYVKLRWHDETRDDDNANANGIVLLLLLLWLSRLLCCRYHVSSVARTTCTLPGLVV